MPIYSRDGHRRDRSPSPTGPKAKPKRVPAESRDELQAVIAELEARNEELDKTKHELERAKRDLAPTKKKLDSTPKELEVAQDELEEVGALVGRGQGADMELTNAGKAVEKAQGTIETAYENLKDIREAGLRIAGVRRGA